MNSHLLLWLGLGLGLGGVFFGSLFWLYYKFKNIFLQLDTVLEKIVKFSNEDPLTGLPNRILFFENFNRLISLPNPDHKKTALLFFDVDHFRNIKDTLGYAIGDEILQEISKRLLFEIKNKELLARLGSDQFVIILNNIKNSAEIEAASKKILKSLSSPFLTQGNEIIPTASIGICIYPDDATDMEILLQCAGIARHKAKQLGGNTYNFYTPEMNTKLAKQRIIESHLRKAIAKNELLACYQPKVDIQTRKIIGAEALLQWNNPELGKVSPVEFIPIAEQTGLILDIGAWILKEACLQTKAWHQQGFTDFSIAINLSAYQFKTGDIAEQIAQDIWDTGLKPACVELELTESLVMENVEKSLLMLRVLKTMGIKISIDDFGTGYSSLSQLTNFPIDSLKIDQSFIAHMDTKGAVIKTIITMAKQLGLKTIAEGVETEAQFDFLKAEGCDLIQGYLFSPPIPAADFTVLMTQNWAQTLPKT